MAAATARVGAYYDPAGDYAGVLFQGVEPNDPVTIGASDLWAVSTLSMKVPATMGRRLIGSGSHATHVVRQLQRLPVDLPITDLEAGVLDSMAELQHTLRSVMSRSSPWTFSRFLTKNPFRRSWSSSRPASDGSDNDLRSRAAGMAFSCADEKVTTPMER
ncbi:DUF6308 family protein [Streptomyces rhizosphaericus]|uniref:DUF6308 family protein n=1 Tax=Streptomyces rhizosphaericus TaxID=114699 RepID=UPI003CD0C31D